MATHQIFLCQFGIFEYRWHSDLYFISCNSYLSRELELEDERECLNWGTLQDGCSQASAFEVSHNYKGYMKDKKAGMLFQVVALHINSQQAVVEEEKLDNRKRLVQVEKPGCCYLINSFQHFKIFFSHFIVYYFFQDCKCLDSQLKMSWVQQKF